MRNDVAVVIVIAIITSTIMVILDNLMTVNVAVFIKVASPMT